MTPQKPNRSHKSKAEQKRKSSAKVLGDGRFVQRAKKPKRQGKNVKSQLIRVDANFADWCRRKALTEGSVTEVTRKLYQKILDAEGAAIDVAVSR